MDIAAFNWIDWSVLSILGFSILISLIRGFIREAISLATWILAIWVAYKYGHDFAQNMLTMVTSDQARDWIGAAILFFGILILGALLSFVVSRFVFFTGLSAVDRILGMAFGFTRGVLLLGVLILIGQVTQFDKNTSWTASQTIPQFSVLTEWLKSFVPEQFEKLKEQYEHKPPAAVTPAPRPEPAQSSLVPVLPQAVDIAKLGVSNAVNRLVPSQNVSPPLPSAAN
jgi:membrane protein required for colicin V production